MTPGHDRRVRPRDLDQMGREIDAHDVAKGKLGGDQQGPSLAATQVDEGEGFQRRQRG